MAEKENSEEEAKEKNAGEGEEKKEGEEGQNGEEGLNPPKKKLGSKKILIIGIAAGVLLLGGIGAALYFTGVIGGSPAPAEGTAEGAAGAGKEAAGGEAEKAAEEKDEGKAPVFYSLGDILVNLTGDGKRPNFLKLKVSLELASEEDQKAIEALKPRIIDNFQVYLRELRVEDLRGSAGLYRLREELLLRVTEAAKPIRIKDVLFQEMLVQ